MRIRGGVEQRRMSFMQWRTMLGGSLNKWRLNWNIDRRVKGFLWNRSILKFERFHDNRCGYYD